MSFDRGATSQQFDFSGALRRDAQVKISTSMAPVDIRIPSATAARIIESTVAAALNLGDGFLEKAGGLLTEAAANGRRLC